MDNSQQFTVRRFSHLSPLLKTATSITRRTSSFDSFPRVIPSSSLPRPKFNPSVNKPVYLMEYNGRIYYSKSYTRFGVLGTKVVFGNPDDLYGKDLSFLVHDFLQVDGTYVVEDIKPLSWFGLGVLNLINSIRNLVSPAFALLSFFSNLIGYRGFEDAFLILGLGYLYNYYIGLNDTSLWVFGILFGLNILMVLVNKFSWFRAFAYFQYYLTRRSSRFKEFVASPFNFNSSHSWVAFGSNAVSHTPWYNMSSSISTELSVYALEEQLFHTVDYFSKSYKATKEDYLKAFSDHESGFKHLGLSDWYAVSYVLEKAFQSRDSELFSAFLQHLGLSKDDENFKTCLVNLRRIAGYKRIED